MTKEELKIMLDNTINSNGKRNITGKSLNLALSQIVDCIGEEFNNREVEIKRNDVNFFDYDGTLLYSYTWEEAKELTELPALPEHDGLEVREWNYTLEDIKAQGVKYIGDANGRYQYIGELTIDDITYLAWNWRGDYSEEYWALLTTGEPKEGDTYHYAECSNNNGTAWAILVDGEGKYYEYEITQVGESIGKADVGACVYGTDKEQMLGSNVLIIERGETELHLYSEESFSVVSIPNTITTGGAPSFYACMFFGELKLPISFNPTSNDNYSLIFDCVVDNIHINGNPNQSNGYFYGCVFRDIYRPQSSFTEMGILPYLLKTNYYKILPHISYIDSIRIYDNSPIDFFIMDFSDYTYVPELGDVYNQYWSPNLIIIPDELYDEWINTTNWADLANKIRPASEYKNILRK